MHVTFSDEQRGDINAFPRVAEPWALHAGDLWPPRLSEDEVSDAFTVLVAVIVCRLSLLWFRCCLSLAKARSGCPSERRNFDVPDPALCDKHPDDDTGGRDLPASFAV